MAEFLFALVSAGTGAMIMYSAIAVLRPQNTGEKKLAIGIIVVCIALLLGGAYTRTIANQQNVTRAINFAEKIAYDEGFEKGLETGLENGFEDGLSEGRYWACKFAEKWLSPEQIEELAQQLKEIY